MKIEWDRKHQDGTAVFKSRSEFWVKERAGSKGYTVRQIPDNGDEWDDFSYWMQYCPHKFIRIESTAGPEKFTRHVTDISILGFFLGNYVVGIAFSEEAP